MPYLDAPANRAADAVDIELEVLLQTSTMRAAGMPPQRLMQSNFRDSYWTLAQLVAHHTVILRGRCQREGYRAIESGDCAGTVLPARVPTC